MEDANFAKYMAGFSQLLDDRLRGVARKEDVQSVKEEIGRLASENAALRAMVCRVQEENTFLKKQIEDIDRKVRRNNLILKGVPNSAEEDLIRVAGGVMSELKSAGQEPKIRQATRLGPGDAPILVEMENSQVIPGLLRNAIKLRNSGVGISRDMSPLARNSCNKMLKLRWLLRNRYPNLDLNMRIQYDKLQINGRIFEWVAEDLRCGNEDGVLSLGSIVKEDVV
ncbi:unnamed protein product, partial [Nesidiocoris tenuis]